jgi:hypothetical protein
MIHIPSTHNKVVISTCRANGEPVVVQPFVGMERVHEGEEREKTWKQVAVYCCLVHM